MTLHFSIVSSQVIINEGFEYPCTEHCPFQKCPIPWIETSGSPDLTFNNVFHSGSKAAHMFVSYLKDCPSLRIGEGIAFTYSFLAGQSYKISYYVRLHDNPPNSLGIVTAKWILPSSNLPELGCEPSSTLCNSINYYIPDIPIGSEIVHNSTLQLNQWTFNEITFNPLESHDQLWFRPYNDPINMDEDYSGRVFIDDIKIECLSDQCACLTNNCNNIINSTGIIKVQNGNNILNDFIDDCYNIKGVFDINHDFNITRSTINFLPGSKIIVRSGVTLYLDQSHLLGCNSMWQGIELENGAKISWFYGSIQDAEYGINYLGNSNESIILGVNFLNCYVGIYSGSGSKKAINSLIAENTFSFAAFKSFFPGQSPLPESRTYAGIELNDVIIDIDKGVNYFYNLQNGIDAYTSDITINDCVINNIIPQNPTAPNCNSNLLIPDGYGIFLKTCRNKANLNHNIITNAIGGIITIFSTLNSENNILNHLSYGITCNNSMSSSKIRIVNCNIDNYSAFGIRFNSPIIFNELLISDNTLSSSDLPSSMSCIGAGINISNTISRNKGIIKSNVLNSIAGHDGVRLDNSVNLELEDNIIIFKNPLFAISCQDGIEVNACKNISIYHNNVTGAGIGRSNGASYNLKASTYIAYCCNTSNNHQIGYNFEGACMPSSLKNNDINLHRFGLRINSNSAIGRQIVQGNKWNIAGNGQNINATNLNPILANRVLSQFVIGLCSQPLWPKRISPVQLECAPVVSKEWFVTNEQSDLPCPSITNCPIPPSQNFNGGTNQSVIPFGEWGLDNEQDSLIAISSYGDSVLVWESQRSLLMKLSCYPNLLGVNSVIDSFYSANLLTNLFEFNKLEYRIRNALVLDNGIILQIKILDSIINSISQQYSSVINSLGSAINRSDSISIIHQTGLIYSNYTNYFIQREFILENITSELTTRLNALDSLNNGLTPISTMELNEKQINNIEINKLLKGVNLNQNDLNILLSIALQCPYKGGRSVYIARTLYNDLVSQDFLNEELCNNNNSTSHPVQLSSSNNDFDVFPNPNNGQIYLKWSQPGNITDIVVFNSLGQELYSINPSLFMDQKALYMDLSNLNYKLYFL